MKVPLLDLKLQYETIKEEVLRVTEEIYQSQYFILGPHVEALEREVVEYCHSKYAVGVSSGTDALIISLMAADIGPGDLVITTPYTFFATAGCIARTGTKPIFADIDPDTYNISPENVENIINRMSGYERERLKGIVPVHLYGQCAEMAPILDLAKRYNLVVIEDAAQAIGAEYRERRAGSMGSFGCFSFFPSKNLGAFGDGGMVTAHSEEWYEKMRMLRVHGSRPKYFHRMIGGNFRLDALQAAIVSVKLKYLDGWTNERRKNASRYRELFAAAGLEQIVKLPVEKECRHIYNQFVINVREKRDELKMFLMNAGIGTEIYYPIPLHLQECFSYLKYKEGDFPVSEHAALHTLALPIYPELTEDQLSYVVEKTKEFYS